MLFVGSIFLLEMAFQNWIVFFAFPALITLSSFLAKGEIILNCQDQEPEMIQQLEEIITEYENCVCFGKSPNCLIA